MLSCPFLISEHYATVTLTFTDKGNETELKIECRAVPESEEERTRDGWQRYYCHAIKQTFGYGARLCWAQDVAATVFDSTFLGFVCFIGFIFLYFGPPSHERIWMWLNSRYHIAPLSTCSFLIVMFTVIKKGHWETRTERDEYRGEKLESYEIFVYV